MTENIAFARRQDIDIDKMHLPGGPSPPQRAAGRHRALDKNELETRAQST
jgi:hypothetical protein